MKKNPASHNPDPKENQPPEPSSILNNLPGIVMRYQLHVDGHEGIQYLSQGTKTLWGLNPQDCLQDNNLVWSLWDKPDLDRLKASLKESARTLSLWQEVWLFRTKDGNVQWQQGTGTPVKEKDGTTTWDIFVQNASSPANPKDATQKKKAEEQLRLSEQRFKALVQDGSDLIAILDPEGTYLYVSPNSFPILQIHPEEFIGTNAFDYIHPDDKNAVLASFSLLEVQDRVAIAPFRFTHKDGSWRWIETIVTNMMNDPAVGGIVANSRDVTDKILHDHQVAARERYFRALVENGADAIVILGPDGQPTYVSPSITRVLGYTEAEALKLNLFEILHPDDLPGIVSKMEEVMASPGVPISGQTSRTRHKDGSWRWLEATITNMLHDPVINGIVDNFRDVTEKVLADHKITFSEKRFRTLVENSGDAVAILAPDGFPKYVSPSIINVLGYTEEEALQINLSNLMHPDDLPLVNEVLTKAMEAPGVPQEPQVARARHKNGEWLHVEAVITNMLHDPVINGIVDNFRDVTEQVNSRRAIEESEEKYRSLFNLSPLPKWIYSLQTYQILDVNDTAIAHYGYTRKEFLSLTIMDLQLKNDLEGIVQTHEGLEKKKGVIHLGVVTHHRKNGSHMKMDISGQKMSYNGQECMMVTSQDVTEKSVLQELDLLERKIMEQSMDIDSNISSLLGAYMKGLEKVFPNMKASVLRVQNNCVWNLASPSLPPAYIKAISGEQIGLNTGSCGHAAYTSKRVVVSDISTDPLWENYKTTALAHGFKACWSQPIFNSQKKVIATFANYYESIRKPTKKELEIFERSASLIGIILENYQKSQELVSSNELFQYVNQATNDAIYDWDVIRDEFSWGEGFYRLFGYQRENKPFTLTDWATLMHPTDKDANQKDWLAFVSDKDQLRWNKEFRFRKADGSYLYVEEKGFPIRDKKGALIRMIGVLSDITQQKNQQLQKSLLAEISQFFTISEEVKPTLVKVLYHLAAIGDFTLAEAWLLNADKSGIMLAATNPSSKASRQFYKETNSIRTLQFDEGLPGKVWKKKEAVIWDNILKHKGFLRKKAAAKIGMNAAMGIPLIHNKEVIGVMVFVSDQPRQTLEAHKTLLTGLSTFLGAEIRRKQLEEEFNQFFQNSPDILCISGPEGYFRRVNPAFCKLLGYTEQEMVSQPFENFVHPDDKNKTNTEFTETIRGDRQANNFENRYRTKDGKWRWVSWSSSEVFGEEGLAFGFGRDITEQRELQDLFKSASELARIGSWEVDLISREVFWSEMTREIHEVDEGYQPDLEGAINFYREDLRDIASSAVQRGIDTATPWDFELPIITGKGSERWIRSIGQAEIIDGKPVRLYGSFQDIHERKVAEMRLQNTTNNIPGVIFQYVHQPNGTNHLRYVSEGARHIWGLEPEVVMKGVGGFWKQVWEEDILAMRQALDESAKNLQKWTHQWRIRHADGRTRWLEGYGTPIAMANGGIYWDMVLFDITEKKDLEILLQRSSKMAKVGSWEIDVARNTVFWSDVTREIREAAPDFEPDLDTGIKNFVEGHSEIIAQKVKDCIAHGTPWDEELQIITFKGNLKWVRTIGQAEFIDGECVRVYGSFQDIDDRKSAQLRLQTTADNIPGAIFQYILHPNGTDTMQQLTKGAQMLWGKTAEECMADPNLIWDQAIAGGDFDYLHESLLHSAKTLERWHCQYRSRLPDGRVIWHEGFGSPQRLADGSVLWDSLIIDVTEKKELERLLDRASHLARIGSWELDLTNKKDDSMYWSSMTKVILEVGEDYDPTLSGGLEFYVPESRALLKQSLDDLIREGGKFDLELLVTTAKGNPRWIRCIGGAEFLDGKCTKVFGSYQDIHERKSAEIGMARQTEYLSSIASAMSIFLQSDDWHQALGDCFSITGHTVDVDRVYYFENHQDPATHKWLFSQRFEWSRWTEMAQIDNPDLQNMPFEAYPDFVAPLQSGKPFQKIVSQMPDTEAKVSLQAQGIVSLLVLPIFVKGSYFGFVGFDDCTRERVWTDDEVAFLQTIINNLSSAIQRRNAQLALHDAFDEKNSILESIGDAFFALDRDFTVTYWNRLAETMLLTPRERIIGQNLWEVFADARHLPSYANYHRAMEEQVTIHFEDHYAPIGKWFEISAYPSAKGLTVYFKDVTEKKKTDLELMRFQKIIENSRDGIAIANHLGEPIYLNPVFAEMLGHTSESLEEVGGPMSVYADNAVAKALFRTLLSGNYWKGDVELVSRTGELLNFYLSGGPIFDENEKLVAIYGIHTDISERKQAEKALAQAYEEKNSILESIGDAFIAMDTQWTVTYWNKEAEKVLGKKREETVGRNLWEVYADAIDLKFYSEYHRAVETGKIVDFEEYYPATRQWFEVSAYPSGRGLSVYFKDVSIRKLAEEAVRQSNERFEKVTEATNDAIWDWDLLNGTLYWGGGFKVLFGHDPERVNPSLESWNRHIHPEDLEEVLSSINEVISDELTSNWQREYRYKKANGNYAYVVDRGVVIRNEQGKAIRMVGAMTDITHRKESEESLKRLNTSLEEQAKKLAMSNAELEQFAYVASHDLQEPLRMVSSFLTQLEKKYHGVLDDKARKYIHFAVDGAKRMRQIILDLLEFSRVGQKEDHPEEVDTVVLVDEILGIHQRIIEEKKAIIRVDKLPKVMTYRSPLSQVFQNLIGNALKYTYEDVAPEVSITFRSKGRYWHFSVQDNGIGIEQEYFTKIFIIFQRLHHREEYSGTGMGLAIVKKIVDTLGGKIWVESEPGKGSTFHFTLPKIYATEKEQD